MPSTDARDVALPRPQVGRQPQHLLITLLGDYWMDQRAPLPSTAMVALLGEFGIADASARAALSRLCRRNLLVRSRHGRQTQYTLSPRAKKILTDGRERILSFGTGAPSWDGAWHVLAFSVPEERRHARHALRTGLRWRGFAPLYDGVWVAARCDVDDVRSLLAELGIDSATVLRCHAEHPSSNERGHPLSAWDLDELSARYREFIREYSSTMALARKGRVTGTDALVTRTTLMDTWRQFPNIDPDLPDEVLSTRWQRSEARELFVSLYDTLRPPAEERVREIVARAT